MENIDKHRKIAAVLHLINGASFVAIGYFILLMAGITPSCTENEVVIRQSTCYMSSLIFFVIPTIVALSPLVALYTFGPKSLTFLERYSILMAILFIPIGTVIGIHTLKLVSSKRSLESTE